MIIIKTRGEDIYFTDQLVKKDATYEFETTSFEGKVQKHILGIDQVIEIIEQEGLVADTRKKKKSLIEEVEEA